MISLLVVDDHAPIRVLLTEALALDGRFTIVGEAGTGLEAIEQARRLRPEAVLLDLAMPVMDGLTALPQLRGLLPRAAIVCLSGMSTRHYESDALESGADRYLEKGGSLLALADELAAAHAAYSP